MLQVEKTIIEGCYILTPQIHYDFRGYFYVPYNSDDINKVVGHNINFIQDNQSYSKSGVIRGLHFQREPYAQTKLVRCVLGKVVDVVVDIRKNSKTFGRHIRVELSDQDGKMLYVPKGCAHGFSVPTVPSIFHYKVDSPWHKDSEECIRWDDPDLGIDWGIPKFMRRISEKDMAGKFVKDINF